MFLFRGRFGGSVGTDEQFHRRTVSHLPKPEAPALQAFQDKNILAQGRRVAEKDCWDLGCFIIFNRMSEIAGRTRTTSPLIELRESLISYNVSLEDENTILRPEIRCPWECF